MRPVLEGDTARALDMQEEGIDGVVDPGQLQPLPGEHARVDLGPGRIGLQRAARHPPGDPLAGKLGPEAAEVDRDQVGRTGVERHRVAAAPLQGAPQLGLEVAREEALGACVVARLVGREAGLEEGAGLGGIVRAPPRRRRSARQSPTRPPSGRDVERLVVGAPFQGGARALQRPQGRALVVGLPARQVRERDRPQHEPLRLLFLG